MPTKKKPTPKNAQRIDAARGGTMPHRYLSRVGRKLLHKKRAEQEAIIGRLESEAAQLQAEAAERRARLDADGPADGDATTIVGFHEAWPAYCALVDASQIVEWDWGPDDEERARYDVDLAKTDASAIAHLRQARLRGSDDQLLGGLTLFRRSRAGRGNQTAGIDVATDLERAQVVAELSGSRLDPADLVREIRRQEKRAHEMPRRLLPEYFAALDRELLAMERTRLARVLTLRIVALRQRKTGQTK